MRRKLLGRSEIHDWWEADIEASGILEVQFDGAPHDVSVMSLDGNRTIAMLSPSGQLYNLLVQDYVNGESRLVPFEFGAIEIVNDGAEISVFLHPPIQ